jgi:mono/diheme cytochrome c family protein
VTLKPKSVFAATIVCIVLAIASNLRIEAQDAHFHKAPAFSAQEKNPYTGQHAAIAEGARLYTRNCGSCHGIGARGTGNIPALSHGAVQSVPDGEVFWFITTGSVANGMPSWAQLPEQQRWQIVTYVKSLKSSTAPSAISLPSGYKPVPTNAAAPPKPFTDFRFEQPGTMRHISVQDLPAPYSTESANNGPQLVTRPQGAWSKAPAGFRVQQYATGLDNPRLSAPHPMATSSSRKAVVASSKFSAESRRRAKLRKLMFSPKD